MVGFHKENIDDNPFSTEEEVIFVVYSVDDGCNNWVHLSSRGKAFLWRQHFLAGDKPKDSPRLLSRDRTETCEIIVGKNTHLSISCKNYPSYLLIYKFH